MKSYPISLAVLCSAAALGLFCSLRLVCGENQPGAQPNNLSEKPVAADGGEIGRMLRKWYSKGTAAGNTGDYYDNRDRGHSNLNMKPYPQLQRIEYTEEEINSRQNWGLQRKVLPHVVFGNSSTSASFDRGGSNARMYYADPAGLDFLFKQYALNNLYIYPEHHDHDPGNKGVGGHGDLFPTNTPYLIISQGSSGSDQAFMKAMPYVLAAFRPEVKKKLIQAGLLMPTIQMILRITNKQLSKREEYLTGKAHPSVFRGSDLNVRRMIEMAHEITLSTIPPMALLKVVGEDTPANGIDYFEPGQTEILANTPAVIARIFRGSSYVRKITLSAQDSTDLNERPLKFYWAILRGDPDRIQIEYLNQAHSIAEITIPYFRRAPVTEGSDLESNRIDVGVFVHNGVYYSPPAFLTFYTLDSEARAYMEDGRPLEIAYDAKTSTISIKDWEAFFSALDPRAESWPCRILRRQFKSREIAGLNGISDDFRKAHAVLVSARTRQEREKAAARAAKDAVKALEAKLAAAQKSPPTEQSEGGGDSIAELTHELDGMRKAYNIAMASTRDSNKAVNMAQKSEKELLQKKLPNLNRGATDLVREALNSSLQDPDLWVGDEEELVLLYKAAGKEARDSYDKIKETLILLGVGKDTGSMLPRLSPVRGFENPLEDRLTRFEKAMVADLNAIILSRIVLPEIVDSERRERFVDFRIAAAKEWRDVYRYAPDGTSMGWRRFQSDGIREFDAQGLLVLDKDSQGRCVRARLVRYELEPQRKDSQGRLIAPFRRKVRVVPTDMIREYGYEGADDWQGHIKRRYLAR